ncbi:MAG: type II toxin-antitoxin system RatA family toxin [Xanthomonadales bacterium]
MEIKRTALVLHSAMDMFRVVQDVPAYPEFLSWCLGATVHEETAECQLASLKIKVGGIVTSFTTRNRFVPGERLTLALVDGPFSHLAGEWQFMALGEEGSKVMLSMNFDFSSSIISSAFRRGFAHVADKLVRDFSKRADAVYGL